MPCVIKANVIDYTKLRLKVYLEEEFQLHAPEQTTEEFFLSNQLLDTFLNISLEFIVYLFSTNL